MTAPKGQEHVPALRMANNVRRKTFFETAIRQVMQGFCLQLIKKAVSPSVFQ
jgi:hypothetical protein